MNVRIPSLELSWLPMSERKSLPTPEIRFVEDKSVSGYYLPKGLRIDEYEHTGKRDVLVVSLTHGVRPSVLAHEFRHMQQRYLPCLPRLGISTFIDFGETFESWSTAIREFYLRPWELDALRFEFKLSKDEQNETSMRLLQ